MSKIIKFNIKKKQKYKNPTPLSMISKIIRNQNKDIIKKFVLENNLSEKYISILEKEFLKPNYYFPTIVQKKNKEKLQLLAM